MENRNLRITRDQWIPVIITIVIAALFRIVPHPPNVAAITGLALFSGAILKNRWAALIPLSAMFLADLAIGFHSGMIFVYGSFVLISWLGSLLNPTSTFFKLTGASLTSSVLFFLITNAGVWLLSDAYPNTWNGLLASYTMGIPFFRYTIIGDLLFTLVFFYGYQLVIYLKHQVHLRYNRNSI
jgi:hypothetical protein